MSFYDSFINEKEFYEFRFTYLDFLLIMHTLKNLNSRKKIMAQQTKVDAIKNYKLGPATGLSKELSGLT